MRFRLTAGCLVLLLLAASGRAAERNIVFFITDDEGPTLGCYGDTAARSPNIDQLAADGTVFLNAFATTASCSASRSVIMSGLHNHRNGQYGHQHNYHKFSSYYNVIGLALPRVLAGAGYRTAHIGKYHVAPEEVYRFETYLEGPLRNPVAMAENCRDFIMDSSDDRPFFLYFGTADPHRGGGTDATSLRELKPDLFGNRPNHGSHPGVREVFFDPADVIVPPFLSDMPETREELAQYYQSCARIDRGVGRLMAILEEAGVYDKTLFVFTSDHGMAFAGAKTTVYEAGLKVPFVVRNPYESTRGVRCTALISHTDITPSLLDFAGGLDRRTNAPIAMVDADEYWRERGENLKENRGPTGGLVSYHGRSWIDLLGSPDAEHHDAIFASHTFHEIQMYYPMRVIRDKRYKLIWNIAHALPFPFASDLWAASSWQAQFRRGSSAKYGQKTVGEYVQRPEFELYDIEQDPNETTNLAGRADRADLLERYQAKLKQLQLETGDPWIMKWDYE